MGLDEAGTALMLRDRRSVTDALAATHGGRIVKATGDGLLTEFPSVVDAVECAAAMQAAIAKLDEGAPRERRMLFRIGINLCDVLVEGDDILGDGVNVAARLEGIAEPGGVCLSSSAYEQVRGKVAVEFADLGEHRLKNIAQPVHVFKIRLESSAKPTPDTMDGWELPMRASAARIWRKTVLAVHPFTVFESDLEAEILADGLVEDILTALARFRLVSIIARDSMFAYRRQPVDVRRAAAETGADYILEGSVRRSGDNLRVSVQLIDAADGSHLWAERYDHRYDDLLAAQDAMARAVIAGLEQPLVTAENRRGAPYRAGATTDVVKAAGWLLFRFDRASNDRAISLLQNAIAENPVAYRRHQALAMGYCWRMAFGWTEEPTEAASHALVAAEEAIRLNDEDAWNHVVLGWSAVYCDQFDRGVAAVRRALEISPHSAVTLGASAWVLGHTGDSAGAVDAFTTSAQLGLQHPFAFMYATGAAWAEFARGAWDDAEKLAELAAVRRPNCFAPLVVLGAISGLRGGGADRVAAIRRRFPQFTLGSLDGFLHLRPAELRDQACRGLRAAGLA
jgi:adenylate cyclase